MTEAELKPILESSKDANELARAAAQAARASEPNLHGLVIEHLQQEEFLGRLDTPEEYRNAARFRLRVARVVEALAHNSEPSARQGFVKLGSHGVFTAEADRVDAWVLATEHVRPLPPEVVKLLDKYSDPDDGSKELVIGALVRNGTAPAIHLLEKKFLDPRHEDDDKIGWLRTDVLSHRNDLVLLEGCERLLKGALSARLKPELVDVLFDYRPGEWFLPATVVAAPPLAQASVEARARLRDIGNWALKHVQLTPPSRDAVQRRLAELERLP